MKSYISLLFMALACVFGVRAADVVTSEPSPLQESSKDVVVYFHADMGNKGLAGVAASTGVYAHTGVITNKSTSNSDWKHAPAKWGDNSPKYKLEYVSPNLWKLNMGDIRTYYGLTADEKARKLAFVFRTADCSKEGKDTGDADIFLDVVEEGYQVSLASDLGGTFVDDAHSTVNFTVTATAPSTLSLSVNGNLVKSAEGVTSLAVPFTFTDRGNYTVTAKGVNGSETREVEETYCFPSGSVRADYPGGVPRQGAVRGADGKVTFCLAAPGKSHVMIVPSWDDYAALDKNVMNYQDYEGQRYFWITVPGLDPDTRYFYYYMVDGTRKVADPYAKLILDPYNDKYISKDVYPGLPEFPADKVGTTVLAVYHENINKYDWQVKDFKGPRAQDLVVYELLLRDFTGTEGAANGDGTLAKAIEKLPYLIDMGVNAIELLPVNEFNGNNSWGYNPNFYFAPDKAYGTPDDYKRFIDICHSHGIAVILDLVFNQSDGLHPWYQMYDIASNPFYNQNAPHSYSVLNDWNQNHPLVEQQWYDCVKYWATEYKVDGFRFDLVKGLGDNESYKSGTEAYNASRVARMTRIHSALKEVKPDAYFINENLAGEKEENEMAADGQMNWANVNNAACQYVMGYSSDSNLNRFYSERDSRAWASTVSYAESHDEERMGYKQNAYGVAGVKGNKEVSKRRIGSLHAQMILSPGPHMIWQFSELGNEQTTKNSSGNDTSPKKVNWNALEDPDVAGLRQNVGELIWIRTQNPELFEKDAIKQMNFAASSWDNGRFLYCSKNGKELILALNPNVSGDRTFECSNMFASKNDGDYRIESASYNTTPSFSASTGRITVPANSYVVIVSNSVSGIDGIETDGAGHRTEVYAVGGDIVINGDYAEAEVYTASGARAPMTGLASGVYLVRVDGVTYKVAVR